MELFIFFLAIVAVIYLASPNVRSFIRRVCKPLKELGRTEPGESITTFIKMAYTVKEVRFVTAFFVCLFLFSKVIPITLEIHHTGDINASNISISHDGKFNIEHDGKYGTPINLKIDHK